jgi:hypothetical protein
VPLFSDRPHSFLVDEDEISFNIDDEDEALLTAAKSSEAWA